MVETLPESTFLGFVLDQDLAFHSHVKRLIQSSIAKVYTLAKVRRFIGCDTTVLIFKSFILSKLEYGDVFCGGLLKKLLSKLQISTNRALRIWLQIDNG